jgi:hypothetical protein
MLCKFNKKLIRIRHNLHIINKLFNPIVIYIFELKQIIFNVLLSHLPLQENQHWTQNIDFDLTNTLYAIMSFLYMIMELC